jgi:hypothetical protein
MSIEQSVEAKDGVCGISVWMEDRRAFTSWDVHYEGGAVLFKYPVKVYYKCVGVCQIARTGQDADFNVTSTPEIPCPPPGSWNSTVDVSMTDAKGDESDGEDNVINSSDINSLTNMVMGGDRNDNDKKYVDKFLKDHKYALKKLKDEAEENLTWWALGYIEGAKLCDCNTTDTKSKKLMSVMHDIYQADKSKRRFS